MVKYISQSMQKHFLAYHAKELCGHILAYMYFGKGHLVDLDSKSVKLGAYFEWITFGNLPKNGIEPKPEYTSRGQMTADYQRAHINREFVLNWMATMGFVVIRKGIRKTRGNHEGTIDLICQCTKRIVLTDGTVLNKGDEIVIDVKYSDLVEKEDPWNKHGWNWSETQRAYHGIQACEYHYITKLPFFFLVKGMYEPTALKFFHVRVTPEAMQAHLQQGDDVYAQLVELERLGVVDPHPSFAACNTCVLRANCKDKYAYDKQPEIITL